MDEHVEPESEPLNQNTQITAPMGVPMNVSTRLLPMIASTEPLLDAIEQVRGTLDSENFHAPGVAVIGNQSSGKSSVLSALTRVDLPRGTGTVTRCPIVVHCERSQECKALVSRDATFSEATEVRDMAYLAEAIARKQPSSGAIENKTVHVKVMRPDVHKLVLIDLPGIKQFGGSKGADEHELTVGLVKEYISNPRMVILVVLPAESDLETCEALRLAREHDPQGKRTLGVFTKVDCLPDSDPIQKRSFCERLTKKGAPQALLAHGYFAVRTRTETEAQEGDSHTDVLDRERALFTKDKYFRELSPDLWGIQTLGEKVSIIQVKMVRQFINEILPDLEARIAERYGRLEALGRPLDDLSERHLIAVRIVERFRDDFSKCAYDRDTSEWVRDAIGSHTSNFANLGGVFDGNANRLRDEVEASIFDPTRGGRQRFEMDPAFIDEVHGRWKDQGDGATRNHEMIFKALIEKYGVLPIRESLKALLDDTIELFGRTVSTIINRHTERFPDFAGQAILLAREHFEKLSDELWKTICMLLSAEVKHSRFGDLEHVDSLREFQKALTSLEDTKRSQLHRVVKSTFDESPALHLALDVLINSEIEAQYSKDMHTADTPFGDVEVYGDEENGIISRDIILVNPFDEFVEVTIAIETDAEISWLRIPASKETIVLQSGEEISIDAVVHTNIMPTGTYTAKIVLDIVWELYSDYSFSIESTIIPVTFYLEAPPDALMSKVDFSNCTGITYLERCTGNVELIDINGFAATTGTYTRAVQAFAGPNINNLNELSVYETNEGALEVELVARAAGKLQVKVLVFNVPIESSDSFDVGCGPTMLPDVDDASTCVCNAGYEIDESTEGATCTRCKACSPGEYAVTSSKKSPCACSDCPEGSYCPDQETVLKCPAGHYCSARTILATPCPENTFQNATGQSSCESCTVLDTRASTFGLIGAESASACSICPSGAICHASQAYMDDDETMECAENPNYSTPATGGTVNVSVQYVAYAAPGHFRFPPLSEAGDGDPANPCVSIDFYTCEDGTERCFGETNTSDPALAQASGCGPAFAGFLCMGCAEGYAKVGDRCLSCATVTPYLLAAFGAAVACALVAFITWRIILRSERRAAKRSLMDGSVDRVTSEAVVTVLKIAYSHLQALALLLLIDVDWHQSVTAVEKMASTVTISGSDVTSSIMCLFDESGDDGERLPGFYAKVLLVYAFPILCALLFGIVWAILWVWDRCSFGIRALYYQGFQLSTMVLLFLAHIILLRTALELFVCTTPEVQHRSFLVADPRIECFAGSHVAWFAVAGFGGLVFYGCGIPALSALLVVKGSNTYLRTFLCKNFRMDCEFWESIVALRKVAMTIFTITLAKFGPIAQGISCLVCLFAALLLHTQVGPYAYPFLNHLEGMGLLTLLVSLTMALYSLSFDAGVDFGLNIFIAVINIAFLLLVIYELMAVTVLFSCTRSSSNNGPPREREGKRLQSWVSSRFSTRYVAGKVSSGVTSDTDDDAGSLQAEIARPSKYLAFSESVVPPRPLDAAELDAANDLEIDQVNDASVLALDEEAIHNDTLGSHGEQETQDPQLISDQQQRQNQEMQQQQRTLQVV
ncbi:Interferon-induced GTP-binding protein Mx1 [Hondaea fermentalgiana]|uniref:Interferon-induced GTP-binding protein Mx1 n=1 Tax=Hondaea fermentalgiana TaxID=2315210 RepID=A0A2R5GH76_9STRA|nr:Interferon-induced GTP-binding protein Mx1 [Hondaea fermentalgiana]|eukprot:GBG30247.1 Interferon-induced GTP-binding protein Mx1 [Hondaea fermentalgiana]